MATVKDVRRLLMLIFEGWIPQDKFTSRGCLALGTEIARAALPRIRPTNNVVEDSPVAAAAPRSPCGRGAVCGVAAPPCSMSAEGVGPSGPLSEVNPCRVQVSWPVATSL